MTHSSYLTFIFILSMYLLLILPLLNTKCVSGKTTENILEATQENQLPTLTNYTNSFQKNNKLFNQTKSLLMGSLAKAAKEGLHAMVGFYEKKDPRLINQGNFLNASHPGTLLSKFSSPIQGAESITKSGIATVAATKFFKQNIITDNVKISRETTEQNLSFLRTQLEGLCPPREPPICNQATLRYRTHDGTCNNQRILRWGSSLMPYNRYLLPEYDDGIEIIRKSIEGSPLPSARFVSLLIHGVKDEESSVTLLLAQWGQLIDHDLASTAQPRPINGSIPRCCGIIDFHSSCLPIKVPKDDPWLAPLNVDCLEMLRSAPATRPDCPLSWREQTNQATSYLDASVIYSNNARLSDRARTFRNGLLIFGNGDPNSDTCLKGAIKSQCIRSGDGRNSEQPGLLALHHVWVTEHNRIAFELSNLNSHWDDEKVYQETRKIIGALFQQITYREFLPIILGPDIYKIFNLELLSSGYYEDYDDHINPTIANTFAAAAFRFGHSLIPKTYMRYDRNHNIINNNVSLHNEFFHGDLGTPGAIHRLLRGMVNQRAELTDEFITAELTNHLFQSGDFPFGLDLAAINIQRGRDHGIPSYINWREPCGLRPINSWNDLAEVVGFKSAQRMQHAYRRIDDIDLFVGGIAEKPVIGGLVGPTFACIIAQQFSNIRRGDRFWYENSGFQNSFTPSQLQSIRQVQFASIICKAVDGGTLQPNVFLPHDTWNNERLNCGSGLLQHINLIPWREFNNFENNRIITGQDFQEEVLNDNDDIFDLTLEQVNLTNLNDEHRTQNNFDFIFSTKHQFQHIDNKLDLNKQRQRHISQRQHNDNITIPSITRRKIIINNIPVTLKRNSTFKEFQYIPQNEKYDKNKKLNQTFKTIFLDFNKLSKTNDNNNETNFEKRRLTDNLTLLRRPQKVLITTQELDEYEIEINIKQKNKRPIAIQTNVWPYGLQNQQIKQRTTKRIYLDSRTTTSQILDYHFNNYRLSTKPPNIIILRDRQNLQNITEKFSENKFKLIDSGTINIANDIQNIKFTLNPDISTKNFSYFTRPNIKPITPFSYNLESNEPSLASATPFSVGKPGTFSKITHRSTIKPEQNSNIYYLPRKNKNDRPFEDYNKTENDNIKFDEKDINNKFDKDGYIRPEHTLHRILTDNSTKYKSDKNNFSDDDFVIPILKNLSFDHTILSRNTQIKILAKDDNQKIISNSKNDKNLRAQLKPVDSLIKLEMFNYDEDKFIPATQNKNKSIFSDELPRPLIF